MDEYLSWGRYPKVSHRLVHRLNWLSDPIFPVVDCTLLPRGLGRSYGDLCVNEGGGLITTRGINRFISFDRQTGVICCEAGTSLDEILQVAIPSGWTLPVTPGTKFVTVGGAIANDVHGKNHHRSGTFGRYVKSFSLARTDKGVLFCSTKENPDLFFATIGGLGLTGLILSAEIQLQRVYGPYIDQESIKFSDLTEFFQISADSEKSYEYTVAWIDCLSGLGRGIFMRGNLSDKPASANTESRTASIPWDFPEICLNRLTMKAFNFLYYHKQLHKVSKGTVHYNPFFYPLDAVCGWNRIYGRRGFFQFQCVVPQEQRCITEILRHIRTTGEGSFLAVLKEFGDIASPGVLSFPRKGVTLCLDFPNRGEKTLRILTDLDNMVKNMGGAIYPAKDAVMSADSFAKYFPNLTKFKQYVDPKFSSSFWRRVIS